MSWSVQGIGKASVLAPKIEADLGAAKCTEPEESVRQAARATIAAALAAQDPATCVRLSASGSQSTIWQPNDAEGRPVPAKLCNSLTITIEPQYGFVE